MRARCVWLPGKHGPRSAKSVAAHTEFGVIEPRLQLTDRIALNTQLATARAELNASLSASAAAQVAYDRARTLNADNKNVSDRAVQEAAARLAAEKTREAGARSLIQVLESLSLPRQLPMYGTSSLSAAAT